MSSSQMLSGLSQIIGSQRDLESIQSLPKYKQVLLCMGTESSGSVDKAALKLALGVDGQADVDNVNAYLQQRCHANGPVTNMRAIAEPDLKFPSVFNGKNMCNLFQKADNILDSALIGNLAEALGFDNPLSKKFGRLVYSKCGVSHRPSLRPPLPSILVSGSVDRIVGYDSPASQPKQASKSQSTEAGPVSGCRADGIWWVFHAATKLRRLCRPTWLEPAWRGSVWRGSVWG